MLQVRLPERGVLLHHRLFAGDAVDEDVEPAVLAIDPADQRLDRQLDRVIDANRDGSPPAALMISAVSSIVSGRWYADGLPRTLRPVQVDDGARLAQRASDASSGAAGGAGDRHVSSASCMRSCPDSAAAPRSSAASTRPYPQPTTAPTVKANEPPIATAKTNAGTNASPGVPRLARLNRSTKTRAPKMPMPFHPPASSAASRRGRPRSSWSDSSARRPARVRSRSAPRGPGKLRRRARVETAERRRQRSAHVNADDDRRDEAHGVERREAPRSQGGRESAPGANTVHARARGRATTRRAG